MLTFSSVLVSELKLILPSYIDEECFVAVDVERLVFDFVAANIDDTECIVTLKVGSWVGVDMWVEVAMAVEVIL